MTRLRFRRLALVTVVTVVASLAGVAAIATPGTSYTERDFGIAAGDHRIPATLTMPTVTRGTEVPAVLLLHGFASSRDEVGDFYARLAADLAERGYASLRIDFAGSGDSRQPFLDNTIDGMVADSRIALQWLIDRPNIIDDRVGIHGFSLGSLVAEIVAGTDARVAAFGSWSGAVANGITGWEDFYATYYPIAVEQGYVEVDLGFTAIMMSPGWFETLAASHGLDDLASYAGPLLAIAGSDDTSVDPVLSRELIRWSGSLDATLRVIVGADHIYHVLTDDQSLAEEVLQITADWYAAKL